MLLQLLALPVADERTLQLLVQSCVMATEVDHQVVRPFLQFVLASSVAQRNAVVWGEAADAGKFVAECIVAHIARHRAAAHTHTVDADFLTYCRANPALQFMSQYVYLAMWRAKCPILAHCPCLVRRPNRVAAWIAYLSDKDFRECATVLAAARSHVQTSQALSVFGNVGARKAGYVRRSSATNALGTIDFVLGQRYTYHKNSSGLNDIDFMLSEAKLGSQLNWGQLFTSPVFPPSFGLLLYILSVVAEPLKLLLTITPSRLFSILSLISPAMPQWQTDTLKFLAQHVSCGRIVELSLDNNGVTVMNDHLAVMKWCLCSFAKRHGLHIQVDGVVLRALNELRLPAQLDVSSRARIVEALGRLQQLGYLGFPDYAYMQVCPVPAFHRRGTGTDSHPFECSPRSSSRCRHAA